MVAPGELWLIAGALHIVHPNNTAATAKRLDLHGSLRHVSKGAAGDLSIGFCEPIVAHASIGAAMVDLDTASLGGARYQTDDTIVAAGAVEFNWVRRVRELDG